MANNKHTFINVTNSDIYGEIKEIKQSFESFNQCIKNIEYRLRSTRKMLELHKLLIFGAYGFTMTLLGFLIAILLHGG